MWAPLLLALGCTRPPDHAATIVLVTWDTVRADHVDARTTPALSALASQGARFTRARTPVPLTLPAHTSLLSGLPPHEHGARDNARFTVSTDVDTITEDLSAAGWRTGAFVSSVVLDSSTGLDQGFETYDDEVALSQVGHAVPFRGGARTVDAAIAWLHALPSDQPAFLWVHLFEPHHPWVPGPQARARFPQDPYRAEIWTADHETGRLLDALGPREQAATIIVTADHGEGLGEHGEQTHGLFAYDSTLRVPLVVGWGPDSGVQKLLQPGVTVDTPVSLTDISGLVRAAVGMETGWAPAPQDPLWVETVAPAFDYGAAPVFGAIRPGERAWFATPEPQVYDLATDPGQTRNIYSPALDAELAAQVQPQARAWPPEDASRSVSTQTAAELRALGYVSGESAAQEQVDARHFLALANLVSLNASGMTQEQAIAQGERLLDGYGPVPALAIFLADRHDALGQHRAGTEILARAAAPGDLALAAEVERRQAQEAEWADLAESIEQHLTQHPDDTTAHFDLGLTLHRLERLDEAATQYRLVLRADPSDTRARLLLARLLGAQRRPEDALSTLDAAPSPSAAMDCLAGRILYRYLDRPDEARERLLACEAAGGALIEPDIGVLGSLTPHTPAP